MFEPKIPAICAVIGFIFSFLIGLFNQATFSVLIVRALGMGFFSGFVVFIIRVLIFSFLPELAQQQNSSGESPNLSGSFVDISVDGSADEINPFVNENQDQDLDDQDLGDQEPLMPIPDFASDTIQDDKGPRTEKVQEKETSSFERPVQEKKLPEKEHISTGKKGSAAVDFLPDLEDFLPKGKDGMPQEEEAPDISAGGSFSASLSTQADMSSSVTEADTMAKAIRTLLARDV